VTEVKELELTTSPKTALQTTVITLHYTT